MFKFFVLNNPQRLLQDAVLRLSPRTSFKNFQGWLYYFIIKVLAELSAALSASLSCSRWQLSYYITFFLSCQVLFSTFFRFFESALSDNFMHYSLLCQSRFYWVPLRSDLIIISPLPSSVKHFFQLFSKDFPTKTFAIRSSHHIRYNIEVAGTVLSYARYPLLNFIVHWILPLFSEPISLSGIRFQSSYPSFDMKLCFANSASNVSFPFSAYFLSAAALI